MGNDQAIPFNFSPKKLYLLRHSDAENLVNKLGDFQRNLSLIGKDKVRDFSVNHSTSLVFDWVLCSTAYRTKETLELLHVKYAQLNLFDTLYLADKQTLLSEIQKVPADVKNLLLVGHNNGLSDLATYLTGKNIHLSTCQMVEIQLEIDDWTFIGQETGSILGNFF